ncbi:MAG: M56 family metallopeptidase [Bacteroidota bacterium]
MELYLLKSVACLAILYAFYKLFLERENMHNFKRFYLLGTLLASFTIPLITFTKYIEPTVNLVPAIATEYAPITYVEVEVAPNYLGYGLWTLYGLGFLFFALKFGRNLFKLIQKIRKNPLYRDRNIFHVLLATPTTPHTFFSYVFLNKQKFEANEIPQEVLLHEQAHAQELHSLDVLFMELLQIVFWFNPLIYLIKNSAKLNHEFLADRAVLNQGAAAADYQNILLAFSSSAHSPSLANSINYSSTRLNQLFSNKSFGQVKKRFTVMKTHTSHRAVWFRSLVLLPLLALLTYGFSNTEFMEKEIDPESPAWNTERATPEQVIRFNELAKKYNAQPLETRTIPLNDLRELETIYQSMSLDQRRDAQPFPECNLPKNTERTDPSKSISRSMTLKIRPNGSYLLNDIPATRSTLAITAKKFHTDLTPRDRNRVINIHITAPKEVSEEEIQFIFETLLEYGFHRLVIGNKEVVRGEGNQPLVGSSSYRDLLGVTDSDSNDNPSGQTTTNNPISVDQKEISIKINNNELMVNGKATSLKNFASTLNRITKGWSSKEMARCHFDIQIYNGDELFMEKLEFEYRKTQVYQHKGTSLIPPPPPPPPAPGVSSGKVALVDIPNEERKALMSQYQKEGGEFYFNNKKVTYFKALSLIDELKSYGFGFGKGPDQNPKIYIYTDESLVPPPPPPPVVIKGVNDGDPNLPPPPPPPPAPEEPLDHLISMAKKGAQFYYEGKKISSDKAIELLKKNDNLNIQTTGYNSKSPKVRISKKPIVVGKSSASSNMPNINIKTDNLSIKTGSVYIKGEEYFYSTKNGHTSYFNKKGEAVDQNGNPMKSTLQKSQKANFNGKTGAEFKNNTERGETISKDAQFYLNDQRISSQEGLKLINDEKNARYQIMNGMGEGGQQVVWISHKPMIENKANLPTATNENIVNQVKVMNEHNAKFYINNNKIDYKEALSYVKENKDAEMTTTMNPPLVIIKTK